MNFRRMANALTRFYDSRLASADLDITAAGEVERDLASILFGMEDMKEGVEAFLAKRPPNWQGR